MLFLNYLDDNFASIGFYKETFYMVFPGFNESDDSGFYFCTLIENSSREEISPFFYYNTSMLKERLALNLAKIDWRVEKLECEINSEDQFVDLMLDKYVKKLDFRGGNGKPKKLIFSSTEPKEEKQKLLKQYLCFVRIGEYLKIFISHDINKDMETIIKFNYYENIELLYACKSSLKTLEKVHNFFNKFHKYGDWFSYHPKVAEAISKIKSKKINV